MSAELVGDLLLFAGMLALVLNHWRLGREVDRLRDSISER